MEELNQLKRCVKEYRDVDNQIRALNKQVYEKRETRKIVEMEMTDLIKQPFFSGVDKLKIDDDGSYIQIHRPETYSKAWSLSKKELEELHRAYFASTKNPTAEGCSAYVIENRKTSLVAREFDFNRVVKE
jgi:hypothetical protein